MRWRAEQTRWSFYFVEVDMGLDLMGAERAERATGGRAVGIRPPPLNQDGRSMITGSQQPDLVAGRTSGPALGDVSSGECQGARERAFSQLAEHDNDSYVVFL